MHANACHALRAFPCGAHHHLSAILRRSLFARCCNLLGRAGAIAMSAGYLQCMDLTASILT